MTVLNRMWRRSFSWATSISLTRATHELTSAIRRTSELSTCRRRQLPTGSSRPLEASLPAMCSHRKPQVASTDSGAVRRIPSGQNRQWRTHRNRRRSEHGTRHPASPSDLSLGGHSASVNTGPPEPRTSLRERPDVGVVLVPYSLLHPPRLARIR